MHLRTTNIIERLNKEFKRRTKPMEIVAGEASVYTILAFVAMKREMSWRNAPFRNSGFRKLKPFAFPLEQVEYCFGIQHERGTALVKVRWRRESWITCVESRAANKQGVGRQPVGTEPHS